MQIYTFLREADFFSPLSGKALQHHFYHNGHELSLVIENSSRLSHQVANHILKIILEDILCYQSVILQYSTSYDVINASAALDRVTGCSPQKYGVVWGPNGEEKKGWGVGGDRTR